MVPMGWQEVTETKSKWDESDGKTGGKHYIPSNAAIACYETERKVVRNRIVCPSCKSKWLNR